VANRVDFSQLLKGGLERIYIWDRQDYSVRLPLNTVAIPEIASSLLPFAGVPVVG